MAKDIKLYKDGNEVTINETQLDNFLDLGWKQEKQEKKNKQTSKKETKTWQHITEKKEL
jgi:hypothetical protein|tara:strand:- start:661 stop:837 length:177 start_codon:yes stop_codon:yes gene_type:complete